MGEYQRILDAMTAAGFSSRELGIIAETSMGTALDGVTQATEPNEQALALVQFAERYGLLPNLRRAVLYTGADRPALQNLLLGNDMESVSGRQQDSDGMYARLRMEAKLDRLIEEMQRNSQQLSLVIQQQAQLAQQQTLFDRRLSVVESAAPRPAPVSTSDRVLFVLFAIILIGMFAYNIWGRML